MASPFIGQITLFGGNFAPRGWAMCDGQLLPIAQHSALFSILGTMYGGDGRSTFGLPEMRGRVAVHPGSGPGLPQVTQGARAGSATTTLTQANLPPHSHPIPCNTDGATDVGPAGKVIAKSARADVGEEFAATSNANMAPTGQAGGGQSFENRPPFIGVPFIIALVGTFPSRS